MATGAAEQGRQAANGLQQQVDPGGTRHSVLSANETEFTGGYLFWQVRRATHAPLGLLARVQTVHHQVVVSWPRRQDRFQVGRHTGDYGQPSLRLADRYRVHRTWTRSFSHSSGTGRVSLARVRAGGQHLLQT